jgi:transcription elongation factor Elf1
MLIPENLKTYSTFVKARIARAKLICHSCPVLTECREWALSEPDPAYTMVAAGMSPRDRNAARKLGRVTA